MPCGGIYTIKPLKNKTAWYDACALCGSFRKNGKTPDHSVEEWEFVLHGECVLKWLETEEGQCVNLHLHHVEINGKVLYEEKAPR